MMLPQQEYSQEPAYLRCLISSDTSKMGTAWLFLSEENCFSRSRVFLLCVSLVLIFSGQNCPVFLAVLKRRNKKLYTKMTVFSVGAGRR